jgi:dienelactone hydrolase
MVANAPDAGRAGLDMMDKQELGEEVMAPAARTLLMVALFALAMASTADAQTQAAPGRLPTGALYGDQDLSPFYRWAQALPDKPGVLLREEAAPSTPVIAAAGKAARILYTSTDVRWRSGIVAVSGTLYVPKGTLPAGGWPLVAWAHGTLGVADRCAPSWAGHKPRDAAYIDKWLENGFAVVTTDYQGLGGPGPHAYLNWQSEGRSVLDAVRAALSSQAGTIANRVVITGQSQGSGAAIGATRLAPTYAPDIGLKAAVATGVISYFPEAAHTAPPLAVPSPAFAVLLMVGGALPDDAPTPDAMMSEKGKPLLTAAREACSPDVAAVAKRDHIDSQDAFSSSSKDFTTHLLSVVDMSPVKLPVPILLGTGLADSLVPPKHQYGAVAALCAAGSSVLWKGYAGATHNGGLHASFDDALAFARNALAGKPAETNCASVTEPGDPGAPAPGLAFND